MSRSSERAGATGPVLVTGSLYLLPDLAAARPRAPSDEKAYDGRTGERLSVFAFAVVVVVAIVGLAFAAGYVVGKILL